MTSKLSRIQEKNISFDISKVVYQCIDILILLVYNKQDGLLVNVFYFYFEYFKKYD